MSASDFNLEELSLKITTLFETCKEELNSQEHSNVQVLLFNVNNALDILLYKVKYEMNRFVEDKCKKGIADKATSVDSKKAECLIRLQTLTSQLTCHVLEDYVKKMEAKKK